MAKHKPKNIIDLKLGKIDRNWTRQEYKLIDRWRRIARKRLNVELAKMDIQGLVLNRMLYGQ